MASLLTAPFTQIEDGNGNPLSGGKVYTYVTGSSLTPKATYTNSSASTPLPNPVILDSNGAAAIWLVGAYRIIVKNAADVTLYDIDNITTDSSATTTFTDNTFEIVDNADATKKLNFQLSSISTGTTRTVTIPNKDGTLAMTSDIAGAVLLSTQTVGSPVASVDFTSGIDSTYRKYIIEATGIQPATNGVDLRGRYYSGGSFVTGIVYNSVTFAKLATGSTDTGTSIANANAFGICNTVHNCGMSNSATDFMHVIIELFTPSSVVVPTFAWRARGNGNNGLINVSGTGSVSSGAAYTGFQLFASSGNINSGVFKLYGVP